MSEPMAITQEMRKSREDKISAIIDRINADIRLSVEHGQNNACFSCDRDNPFYVDVRKKFESCGYRIKPTGRINGIWQLTEDILW